MDAVTDFLAMGGYAAYVWSALGLTALVLIGLLAITLRTARRREAELRLFRDAENDERGDPRRGRQQTPERSGPGGKRGGGPNSTQSSAQGPAQSYET